MIRVLHMAPFGGGSQGGIESLLMNIYRKIDRSKIQFDFLTYGDPSYFSEEIESLGGRVYRLTSRKENPVKAYMETKHFMQKQGGNYRFLHLHLCSASNILPLKLNCKIPLVIAHAHSSAALGGVAGLLHRYNQRYLLSHSDFLLSCSDLAAIHMYGKKYNEDKRYLFLPNAIFLEPYKFSERVRGSVRNEFAISDDEVLYGYVGRLEKVKNTPFLINILSELLKRQTKAKMLIVGDGAEKDVLLHKAQMLKLEDKVMITGARKDVDRLLQAMDCFVSASHVEGFPVSVVEAQAAGLPCVVSDAITRQVNITDLVGFAPDSGTAEQWAEILMKKTVSTDRAFYWKQLSQSPFNICEMVKMLEYLYLKEEIDGIDRSGNI